MEMLWKAWEEWNALEDKSWQDYVVLVSLLVLPAAILLHFIHYFDLLYQLQLWVEYCLQPVPAMNIPMDKSITHDDGITSPPNQKVNLMEKRGCIQCYDPATKQKLGQVVAMTPQDVNEVCAKAKKAQETWKHTTFAQRRQVLRTLQKYICAHVRDICRVSARDSGKPAVDAVLGEILTTTEKIRTIVSQGQAWLRPQYRPTGPMFVHKTAVLEYVPLGVIGTIAPWNYPFHNYMNHIISGIFAGNAVVGKVSEHTSWSSIYYSAIVREALRVNGHDPDLLQTVTGFGDAGAALVSSPFVDKIIFTGSPEIGKKVMETASKHLKPVILELGGKDPMVLMDDCKLDSVIPWVMRGCFQNGGQNCVGVERVFVYSGIHDEFLDKIVPKVKALRQGIPLETCGSTADIDCGPMIMPEQLEKIQELVNNAVQLGAKVHCGGQLTKGSQFYPPTVLSGVTPKMRIFREEVFGPVMTIIQVPNNDDSQCLEMINDSDFGLGSSVYCTDQKRGLRLGKQIRSGMCCINDFGSNYLVQSLPFGGVKDSGFGRFAGIEGLRNLCLERSILVDRIPGVKTSIPTPIDYPIDKEKGFPFASGLIQLFYNESLVAKVKAIVDLIKYG